MLSGTLVGMDELSNLIASAGTVVATFVTLFLLRQGQRDRRDLLEDRRRDQAKRVTLWVGWNENSPHASLARPVIPAIYVANASDATVYEVFVDFYDPADQRRTRIDVGQVPPGQTSHRDVHAPQPKVANWEPTSLLPRLFFRDSEGKSWTRDLLGRLHPDPGAERDGFLEENGRLALGLPQPGSEPTR